MNHSVDGDGDQALNRRMEMSSRNVEEFAYSSSSRSGFGADVASDICGGNVSSGGVSAKRVFQSLGSVP